MKRKKLALHRDTVRTLDPMALDPADGGLPTLVASCPCSFVSCIPYCTLSPTKCVPTVCTI